MSTVREFVFEIALCAHLEASTDAIVARQLGASSGGDRRVLDIVLVEPGPAFDQRAMLTDGAIPDRLLSAEIGRGNFRDWRRVLGSGMAARRAVDRGVEIGVLERERTRGRERIRLVDRYPEAWFDRIVAIENKPDLASPGDLYEQLQFDVSLGVVDAVVLVTASHVTRAHVHRLPDEVGVWRFDPEAATLDVRKEASALDVEAPGIEILDRHTGRTEIAVVDADAKARLRRRLAERAYGRGWRRFPLPACANLDPDAGPAPVTPYCSAFGRLVDPAHECGEACPAHSPAPPPAVDRAAVREANSPWVYDPPDRRRQQADLSRFD